MSQRDTKRTERALNRGRASLRLALKIAARTSIRSLGRSVLIAVMVALPVAGLTTAAVVFDSTQPTVAERLTTELGETEAKLKVVLPGEPVHHPPTQPERWGSAHSGEIDPTFELSNLFPADTRILHQHPLTVTSETATGVAAFNALEGPAWDESFAGRFAIAKGRTPRADSQVMVTPAMLPRLGVALGDSVLLTSPKRMTVTVVGVLDAPIWADDATYFFGREGALDDSPESARYETADYYLPDTELDWAAVQELNQHGVTVLSHVVLENPTTGPAELDDGALTPVIALIAIIAAFAAFEVVLLAGAAFTVTARQQQRSLATLSSVGATRGMLFRVITANGLVLGAIGGVLGVAVGIGAAIAFIAVTSNGSSTQYFGFHIPWLWLAAIAAFAILIGWVSSLLPARNAIRLDVVAALRGARRPSTETPSTPIEGVIMLGIGVALTLAGGILAAIFIEETRGTSTTHPLTWLPVLMLMVGPILGQMGLIKCGPLVLRLAARVLGKVSLGARLGARDAARNPGRSVPALAAIMTTVFVAIVGMNLAASFQQRQMEMFSYGRMPGQVEVMLDGVMWPDLGGEPELVAYESSAQVVSALRNSLDVDELRVLSSSPEPAMLEPPQSEPDEEPVVYPTARVPQENLCPLDPDSVDHKPEYEDSEALQSRAIEADPRCQWSSFSSLHGFKDHLWVGGVDDLALVLGRDPSDEAKKTLSGGGAVSLHAAYVLDGEFEIAWLTEAELGYFASRFAPDIRTDILPAVVDDPGLRGIYFGVFISTETADSLGIDYQESTVLASLQSEPDAAALDQVNAALLSLRPPGAVNLDLMRAEIPTFAEVWAWGLLLLGGLVAVASATVAIGLAKFDGRQDDATLASLGGGRMLRRSFAFWQALLLAGLGTLLGVGIGLIPPLALSANPELPFAPPWLQMGLALVVLPLVIACGSWLVAGKSKASGRRMAIS